jgi:hypothetical protein
MRRVWIPARCRKKKPRPRKPSKLDFGSVALDKDAMFSLSYNGMTEDEALALAEKFDWKAIQAATKK